MNKNAFGKTGLEVTPIGFGGAEVGNSVSDTDKARELVHAVLDAGINLIDTAACYGDSESKIGEVASDRRDEFILVSKCGHPREDLPGESWSSELITASVDRSLKRLKTDHLDVVLLHSCDADQLASRDTVDALVRCKNAGKTRFIGYSGDADAAERAVGMDVFDVLETSVNVVDQQAIDRYLPTARSQRMGVIAKRPIANGAWRGLDKLHGFYKDYARPYAERIGAMGLTPETVGFDGSWIELALRFTLHQTAVSTAIVGSTNPDHIRKDVEVANDGPLPDEVVQALRDLWARHDDGSWVGQI
jgi:hypothetical protein